MIIALKKHEDNKHNNCIITFLVNAVILTQVLIILDDNTLKHELIELTYETFLILII